MDQARIEQSERLDDEAQQLYLAGNYPECLKKMVAATRLAKEAYFGQPGASAAMQMQREAQIRLLLGDLDNAELLIVEARDEHWLPLLKQSREARNREMAGVIVSQVVDCTIYVGNILLQAGRYRQAQCELDEALRLRDTFPPSEFDEEGQRQIAVATLQLGLVKLKCGDLIGARLLMEEAYERARRILQTTDHYECVQIALEYGHLLHEVHEYAHAKKILSELLPICRRVFPLDRYPNGHPYVVGCLTHLGYSEILLGSYQVAETHLLNAAAMHQKFIGGGVDDTLADIWNKLGIAAQWQMKFEQAGEFYQTSLDARKKLHNAVPHVHLGDALYNMGAFKILRKQFEEALTHLKNAQDIWDAIYDAADVHSIPIGVTRTKLARAMAAIGTRDWKSAWQHSRDALIDIQVTVETFALQSSEVEAINLASEVGFFQSVYVSACAGGLVAPDANLLLRNKASVFSVFWERQRSVFETSELDADQRQAVGEWREVRQKLAAALAFKTIEEREADTIDYLTQEKERLERQLPLGMRASGSEHIDASELASRMKQGTVFIDVIKYDHVDPTRNGEIALARYAVLIVGPGKSPVFVDLGRAKEIESTVADWIAQITRGHREEAVPDIERLIWRPIAEVISSWECHTLYMAPDGELAAIPWAAIPCGNNGMRLVEQYRIAMVPNADFFAKNLKPLEGESPTRAGRFLLVSDVDFGEVADSSQEREGTPGKSGMVFRRLPGTALEAEVIRPLIPNLPGSLELFELRRGEATVQRVCKEMSSARTAHIATHGVFSNPSHTAPTATLGSDRAMSPNGMRIGTEARNPLVNVAVVLAGANLPVHKRNEESFLSGEVLAALDLRRCRLCVLPDCHTAKGEVARGAGVFGLQRALHQAGVGDVVACLWGVSDDVTPLLMKMFYEKLAAGSAPMDALRACQLHALRNPATTSAGGTRSDDADFEVHEESNAVSPTSRPTDAVAATRDWAGFVISGIGE